MDHGEIIERLDRNSLVFASLFEGISREEYLWKPQPEKWCLLEIVCHLFDEEREDFRARLKHTLETPQLPMPKIDPQGWVTERKYIEKDFRETVNAFITERKKSVQWLHTLTSPAWSNEYDHPSAGKLSAEMFLTNWLAHDYLHFRQITFTKYQYLIKHFSTRYDYAGNW